MSAEAPEITDHCGDALESDADVFAAAPPEIGPVVSVWTSLKRTEQPHTPSSRIKVVLLPGGIAAGVGIVIVVAMTIDSPGSFLIPLGLGAIAALITWFSIKFSHTLTYVGKRGVAAFTMIDTRARIARTELFLFKQATEIRARQTRRFVNNSYQGTDFSFYWSNEAGETVYVISDTHHSEEGNPPPESRYHHALAAEAAWSDHILRRMKTELKQSGAINFNVGSDDWIKVGRGFLDLSFKGKTAHCAAADVAGVSLENGVFTIKRRDAKVGWFSAKGVFSFAYDSMANAKVFLMAVDELLGLKYNPLPKP